MFFFNFSFPTAEQRMEDLLCYIDVTVTIGVRNLWTHAGFICINSFCIQGKTLLILSFSNKCFGLTKKRRYKNLCLLIKT